MCQQIKKIQLNTRCYCGSPQCLTGRASPAPDNIRLPGFALPASRKAMATETSPSPPWEAGDCPRNIARGTPAPPGVTPFHSSRLLSATLSCSQATVGASGGFTRQQGQEGKVNSRQRAALPGGKVAHFVPHLTRRNPEKYETPAGAV